MSDDLERFSAFLPFPKMAHLLESELFERFNVGAKNATRLGELVLIPDFPKEKGSPYFSRCSSFSLQKKSFSSISEAAGILKKIQRNWAAYCFSFFRRSALIQEKLPYIHVKSRSFPCEIPNTPMGFFSLLSQNELIFSPKTSSPFPLGAISFLEDHEHPPSRAYLKIWEALTVAHTCFDFPFPVSGEKCFDAGACPGGWTWAMKNCGVFVFSVDRSPLSEELMKDANVLFLPHDAFTLSVDDVCEKLNTQKVDWLLSDVICYPSRLLEWVQKWIESGRAKHIICTIKMQGAIDWLLVLEFASISGAHVLHLNKNKHELTFFWKEKTP